MADIQRIERNTTAIVMPGRLRPTTHAGTARRVRQPERAPTPRQNRLTGRAVPPPPNYVPVLGLVKGALRAEWARPNERRFATLAEAQASLDAWVEEYNTVRPHQSLGGLVLDGRTIRLGET